MTRVQYIKYGKKDVIEKRVWKQEQREILYLEYRIEKKKL